MLRRGRGRAPQGEARANRADEASQREVGRGLTAVAPQHARLGRVEFEELGREVHQREHARANLWPQVRRLWLPLLGVRVLQLGRERGGRRLVAARRPVLLQQPVLGVVHLALPAVDGQLEERIELGGRLLEAAAVPHGTRLVVDDLAPVQDEEGAVAQLLVQPQPRGRRRAALAALLVAQIHMHAARERDWRVDALHADGEEGTDSGTVAPLLGAPRVLRKAQHEALHAHARHRRCGRQRRALRRSERVEGAHVVRYVRPLDAARDVLPGAVLVAHLEPRREPRRRRDKLRLMHLLEIVGGGVVLGLHLHAHSHVRVVVVVVALTPVGARDRVHQTVRQGYRAVGVIDEERAARLLLLAHQLHQLAHRTQRRRLRGPRRVRTEHGRLVLGRLCLVGRGAPVEGELAVCGLQQPDDDAPHVHDLALGEGSKVRVDGAAHARRDQGLAAVREALVGEDGDLRLEAERRLKHLEADAKVVERALVAHNRCSRVLFFGVANIKGHGEVDCRVGEHAEHVARAVACTEFGRSRELEGDA
mmetsp:Transcript_30697/g.97952  ORF Transcript_30697/g.97952 Transcript_30697/m.97952 type:complete len:535 (-) Transcript_30697:247-1851(-)